MSVGKDVKKKGPSCTVGGNADWCSHCGKKYGLTSKKLKMELPYDPVFLFLGTHLKKPETLT